MKASKWIDRVKVKKNLSSDYAVAKALGITQSAISVLRVRESTLSDEASLKVATSLGIAPVIVLVDQALERAKTDDARRAWADIINVLVGNEKAPQLAGLGIGGNGGIRTCKCAGV
jgi:plasmid maintenance system antidote protein VapI